MSTFVLMKILESAPRRYDRGIRILTCGKLDAVYDRLLSCVEEGQKVLDLGCGTGAMALRASQKGALVKGIDINAQMLEIAQKRAEKLNLKNIEFCEKGVAELGNEESESYDVIMSGLCFSELTTDELTYTLEEVVRILKHGGHLLVADETRPKTRLKQILQWFIRTPLTIIAYLVTQTTTHAVTRLPEKVEKSGLSIVSVSTNWLGDFVEIVGIKRGQK